MESTTRTTVDPDLLLAQSDWVQRLARRLVADEDRARDVAQDALLVALERPPEKAGNEISLRAWLARVVRSIVHVGARSEARRRVRETSAARPPQSDSVADTLARASQLQLVVDTVMELEEPYRAALLMTYFDGLSSAEVGRRTGASEVAVRKRVSRGLQRLREKLDRRHGGDRTAWVSALAPWLAWRRPVESTAVSAGGWAVGTKVAAALLAAGGGTFALHGLGAEPDVRPLAYERPADVVQAPRIVRRAVTPRRERFAGREPHVSHGWLNAVTASGSRAAWRIESAGAPWPGAATEGVERATFRLPVGRPLELVVDAGAGHAVLTLEPFAPGEVRDVVVSLATAEQALAPPAETGELAQGSTDEPRTEPASGASESRWLARYVPASAEARPQRRTYVAAPRPTAHRLTEMPLVEAVQAWTQLGPGFATGDDDAGAPFFASIGHASAGGLVWHEPQGSGSSHRLATSSTLAQGLGGFGAAQALAGGLAMLAATSAGEDPARVVVLDVTTGWPTLADASFLVASESGRPALVAVTADGRMGVAPLVGAQVPVVPVRPSASLFVDSLAETLAGARVVVIDVDGVELVRARPTELARGVRLPRGTARVRFLDGDGSELAARELTLAAGANAVQ